jgi:hypothetical protein
MTNTDPDMWRRLYDGQATHLWETSTSIPLDVKLAIEEAVVAEREACAKIVESGCDCSHVTYACDCSARWSAAIRARK